MILSSLCVDERLIWTCFQVDVTPWKGVELHSLTAGLDLALFDWYSFEVLGQHFHR